MSISKVVSAVTVLVVLVLLGVAIVASKRVVSIPTTSTETPQTVYITSTTTNYVSTTTTIEVPGHTGETASVVNAFQGPAARIPSFNLTVPGTYQTTASQNTYGGISTAGSYNFYVNNVLAFTINVFSKEAWSNIRIQETDAAANGNTNAYLGEGHYLGENKDWIFADITGAYAVPSNVSF